MFWRESESEIPVRRRFFDGVTRLAVKIEKWELEPGSSEGNHTHDESHREGSLEEVYYSLEGNGVMNVEGQNHCVTAGAAVMVPPGYDHGLCNTGNSQLKLLLLWGTPLE